MIKLLHLEIHDWCSACPHLEWDISDDRYVCTHKDRPALAVFPKRMDDMPFIPYWCPLPSWKEGDKF